VLRLHRGGLGVEGDQRSGTEAVDEGGNVGEVVYDLDVEGGGLVDRQPVTRGEA